MTAGPLAAGWEWLRRLKPSLSVSSGHSAAMFRRIRWQLTAWYTGILAVVIVLFAIAVYAGAQHAILQPVDDDAHGKASFVATHWSAGFGPGGSSTPCTAHDLAGQSLWACYDLDGKLITSSFDVGGGYNSAFIDQSLAKSVLQHGPVTSTADVGESGSVRRYFVAVQIGNGGPVVGVVEAGAPMSAANNALHNLLILILIIAPIALLGAGAGGAFLAERSLAPARLAYARQRNFVADASHELRTPLTMLRADADVLLRSRENLDADQVELVQDMVAEASHMALLANTMLDLARLEAGDVPIEQEVIDLGDLASNVAHRTAALAAEKGVTVRVEKAEDVLVVADRTLLEQALLGLIDNGIKYNRAEGEVSVSIRRVDQRAVVTVRDTGVGIEPQHLPRLGERFYRADASRTGEHSGAGLGIAIARTIAMRHSGTLELASEPGSGTTAVLSLPAA